MQRIFAAVLSLVIALHAVLGCCWHHAHGASPHDRSQSADRLHRHGGDHCGHHSEWPAQDGQQPADDCDEVGCVFVRGELSRPVDTLGDAQFASLSRDQAASTDSEIARFELVASHHSHAPALRLHLRLSVLLI